MKRINFIIFLIWFGCTRSIIDQTEGHAASPDR